MAKILVLGGTAWLGREVAAEAVRRGHSVTALARGESGPAPDGVTWVRADRSAVGAYQAVQGSDWDEVVDVSWQPGLVRSAVAALGERTGHWTYVSSCSVYADHSRPGVAEDATLLPALADDEADLDSYGEAKVACEQAVLEGLDGRALLARAGLIGGPGDPSDRYGYWVARFALAGTGPVLVPDAPDQPTQTIDVRDLAAWLVAAGEAGVAGAVNAVGERQALGTVWAAAAAVAGHSGQVVAADPGWLVEHKVEEWAGPRSLPLWIGAPSHAGFGARSDARARSLGLVRRPSEQTLADTLAFERERGLDRERRAGLTRTEELELIDAWRERRA